MNFVQHREYLFFWPFVTFLVEVLVIELCLVIILQMLQFETALFDLQILYIASGHQRNNDIGKIQRFDRRKKLLLILLPKHMVTLGIGGFIDLSLTTTGELKPNIDPSPCTV